MIQRFALILLLFAMTACSGADRSGPPPVRDANSQLGGTVQVRGGDTAWSIAQAAGVPVRDLIEANGLRPPYRLQAGQELYIPNLRLHRVRSGESISVIAERFGVGRFELARLNRIGPPYRIFPRQILKIPGSASPGGIRELGETQLAAAPPSPPRRVTGSSASQPRSGRPRTAVRSAPVRPSAPARPGPAASKDAGLIWPVGGRITSGFGPKAGGLHNDGVNILAPAGTRVRAAAAGSVVYAGNEIRGFGNLVLIRHRNGLTTAYAHLDEMLVTRGQKVRKGAPIATVGRSGGVNPPQLHFEIRRGRKALDPVRTLGPVPAA